MPDNIPPDASSSSGTVVRAIRGLGSTLVGQGDGRFAYPKFYQQPGLRPGIEHFLEAEEGDSPPFHITCIDYGPGYLNRMAIRDFNEFLATPRPSNVHVRWFNIDGLNAHAVQQFQSHFEFHLLVAEDILSVYERPRSQDYGSYLFMVFRQIMMHHKKWINEQISLLLYEDTLVTFQEVEGDLLEPIRARLERDNSRFRNGKADYLMYAILDCIVDHYFPICEKYGQHLDVLEDLLLRRPKAINRQQLFEINRDLSALRRQVLAMRDLLIALGKSQSPLIGDPAKVFLRDIYDHCIQVIDVIEAYQDSANGLREF